MNDITGLLNNVESEYKDVLTAANFDYLELDTEKDLSLGEYLEFKIYVEVGAIITFCANKSTEDYIGVLANGNLFVQQNSIFNGSTVNIPTGINTIKYRRALDGKNFISANGGLEYELTALDNNPFSLGYFARRTVSYYNLEVFNFTINTETFKPDGNGLTYEVSNGTVVTRNTSHSGALDYINHELIQNI